MKFGITLFILFSSLFVELSVNAENLPPNPPSIGNLEKSNEKKEEINNKQKTVSNPETEKKINPDLPPSSFSSQKPDQKENEKNTIYPDGYKKEEKKETPKHIDFYGEEKKQPDDLEKEKIKSEKNITTSNENKKDNTQKTVVNEKVNSTWINSSINNLDKIGDLKVPAWIDYNSFIGQKDFSLMLLRVTKINNKDFFGELDQNNLDKTISRGLAFDSAIKAFGLEKEMQRIGGTYRSKFKDLKPEHKYYNACLTAEVLKLSAGYPDNTFRADDSLKWSEGIAIVEAVHRWASLLPEQTPLQKAADFKKNIWFYFLDGFRLVLTLVYSILSIIFLVRSWRRAKNDKSGFKEIIASLCLATICLFIMWINEMLYARELIGKPIYYIISTISVIAGLFLIRASSLISKQTEPKPKANIEVAYVEYVDISRGEMFVVDSISKRRILSLISNDTKVFNKENKLIGKAFLSEIAVGDVVSLTGTEQLSGGSVVKTDTIYLMASKQTNSVKQSKTQYNQIENSEEIQIQNIIRKKN